MAQAGRSCRYAGASEALPRAAEVAAPAPEDRERRVRRQRPAGPREAPDDRRARPEPLSAGRDAFLRLPGGLPVPEDDGAADHLPGAALPPLALPATDGSLVELAALPGRAVVFAYPRTGSPGIPVPAEWDAIPGARGCTPQACAYRD